MTAVARRFAVLTVLAIGLTGPTAWGQPASLARFEGRRLEEALTEMQRRGLRIIFTTEAVRPDMRVRTEPTGATPRALLEGLLAPHGLMVRDGPGGTLIVVRNPRARAWRASRTEPLAPTPPAPGPPPLAVPTSEATEALRFEASVDVAQAGPAGSATSLVVHPLEVAALAGGFENLFRAVQALPGVVGTEELGSRISVRGGSPDQNLTVMDGIEIHNPFRLTVTADDLATVGLASTFNAETIERVELYPGAFDVRYGDRLSSLLVVEHREGAEAQAVQGAAFVGLADANVIGEGRLPHASGSWLVSARRTYLDLVPDRVLRATVPTFQDVHTRGLWRVRPNHRVSFVATTGHERSRTSSIVAQDYGQTTSGNNALVALTHQAVLGSRTTLRTVASRARIADGYTAFERSLDNSRGANTRESVAAGGLLEFQFARHLRVRDIALRHDLRAAVTADHLVDAGAEVHALDTRWDWAIEGTRNQQQANPASIRLGLGLPDVIDSSVAAVRFGGWVQDRWQILPRLALQAGLRVDRSSITAETTWSPRLSASLAVGSSWRVDGAVRVHTQTPGYEKTSQSDYFLDLTRRAADLAPERALHVVGGVQRLLPGGVSLRVDGYYKRFSDLIIGRLESDVERQTRLASYDVPSSLWSHVPAAPQITVAPINGGSGRATGFELLASRTTYRRIPVSGWASYSYGRAVQTVYGVRMPFDYDRRHAVSVVASVRIRPRLDLSATGRWASGLPRTAVRDVRLALVPDVHDVDADGNRSEQIPQRDPSGAPLFQPDFGTIADLNQARQPRFGRIDTRLTYRPRWAGERWTFHLDFINVTNASNVSQVDTSLVFNPTGDRPAIVEVPGDRGIPFFPSFGVRVWF